MQRRAEAVSARCVWNHIPRPVKCQLGCSIGRDSPHLARALPFGDLNRESGEVGAKPLGGVGVDSHLALREFFLGHDHDAAAGRLRVCESQTDEQAEQRVARGGSPARGLLRGVESPIENEDYVTALLRRSR